MLGFSLSLCIGSSYEHKAHSGDDWSNYHCNGDGNAIVVIWNVGHCKFSEHDTSYASYCAWEAMRPCNRQKLQTG